jgi:hypothetical protein
LVLRGPATLKILDAQTFELSERGVLVFHTSAARSPQEGSAVVAAGRWRLDLPLARSVGLVELTPEGAVRVAMLRGSMRLGAEGPQVSAGTQVTMDPTGALSSPRKIADPGEFDLLVKRTGGE